MVPAVGRQSGGDEGRLPFPQGTSCHSRPASRSRLLDLLHQAIAPAVLTSCCDFPLQDLPETVLRRGRHHTQHKRAADSLLPAYIRAALCCYVARSHLSPPSTKSSSLNLALVAASNKTGFPDYTHSPHFLSGPALFHSLPLSLLQTNILSLPLAGTVCSCRRGTLPAQLWRQQVLLSPSQKMQGGNKHGSLPSTNHLEGTHSTVRKAGQKGRASGRWATAIWCDGQCGDINEPEMHLGDN